MMKGDGLIFSCIRSWPHLFWWHSEWFSGIDKMGTFKELLWSFFCNCRDIWTFKLTHRLQNLFSFWQHFLQLFGCNLQKYPDNLEKAAELAVSSVQVWQFMDSVVYTIYKFVKKKQHCKMYQWCHYLCVDVMRYLFCKSWGQSLVNVLNLNLSLACRQCWYRHWKLMRRQGCPKMVEWKPLSFA